MNLQEMMDMYYEDGLVLCQDLAQVKMRYSSD